MTLKYRRADFPDDFLFGVSTSAYQIEGHAYGGAGSTHWDTFAATPGNVVNAENGDIACDHYHRWSEDLDLIADGGFDVYRFSASWARVMPDGRSVNPEGLDFYDRLVEGMLERGIKPALTLYHWELPSALSDLGGWRNRDIAGWFADYAQALMARIGDRLWSTATINEFWCVSWLSHFLGHHAPGLRDIRAASRAIHHVLLAHGTATQAMRAAGHDNLGAVFNLEHSEPADASPEARAAADRYDAIYNGAFLGPVFNRAYPEPLLDGIAPHLPDDWQDDMDTIATPVDWAGINYYTRKLIAPAPGPFPSLAEVEGPLPKTYMGWEIYPDGLGQFLRRVARDHTGSLPLYVTENGMAAPDAFQDGQVDDADRIGYFNGHLAQVRGAIDDGIPVKGYFAWSLMDNYEWAFGYDKRFGMVHVDFDSLERTPKASYHAFKHALSRD
ncbi:GH1 family beta-glucosidase [Maritimibacter dapengensis]|uniref:Beta-glucosidase n=1 Tax=Maritimibacter dapengensis TaxID=2836868 RepID=A0ABS6T2S0_9RHOB|nr:GH1 family beta-glucosidase [Maritimibacter dapengensis]MBV7379424.1 beta-glucosidase [Maritimibacter dapengensis]